MQKAKKLSLAKTSLKENIYKKHFDLVDPTYAKEHYGTYLIFKQTVETTKIHSRIYMSAVNNSEYIKTLEKKGYRKTNLSCQGYKKKHIRTQIAS